MSDQPEATAPNPDAVGSAPLLILPAELHYEIFEKLFAKDLIALSSCHSKFRRRLVPSVFKNTQIELRCERWRDAGDYIYTKDIHATADRIRDLLGSDSILPLAIRCLVKTLSVTCADYYTVKYAVYSGGDIPIGEMMRMFPNLTRLNFKLSVNVDREHDEIASQRACALFRDIGAQLRSNSNIYFSAELQLVHPVHLEILLCMSHLTELTLKGLSYLDMHNIVFLAEAIVNSRRLTKLKFGDKIAVDLDGILSHVPGNLALRSLRLQGMGTLRLANARKLANLEEFHLKVGPGWLSEFPSQANFLADRDIWKSLAGAGVQLKRIGYTPSFKRSEWAGFIVYLKILKRPDEVERLNVTWLETLVNQHPEMVVEFRSRVLPRFKKAKGYDNIQRHLRIFMDRAGMQMDPDTIVNTG